MNAKRLISEAAGKLELARELCLDRQNPLDIDVALSVLRIVERRESAAIATGVLAYDAAKSKSSEHHDGVDG